jgi:hypothetical protein
VNWKAEHARGLTTSDVPTPGGRTLQETPFVLGGVWQVAEIRVFRN